MAFKLNKTEENELQKLKSEVNDAYAELEKTIDDYVEEEKELRSPIEVAAALYNEKLTNLRSFVEEVASDRRNEFDEKSDSWKEGDNASSAEEWISTWENVDLDDIVISYPDELEQDFENHADVELPIEP